MYDAAIQRLRALYDGLQRAHGHYDLTGSVDSRGKVQGKAVTKQEDITDQHWLDHLEGTHGLGIVPIRDDGNCRFGAIDVDIYPLDLAELENRIRESHLPLVVCRTKSGGAHCYLFFKEPVRADITRRKLADWAVALGYPGVEVFPKQDKLANESDSGSWINMPYFNAAESERYALYQGAPQALDDFLEQAEALSITLDTLQRIHIEHLDEMADAPPCLQTLCQAKVPEGARNEVMFALGVYAKLKHGDEWEQALDKFNQAHFETPLGFKELGALVKTHSRKDYVYPCKREPLVSRCAKDICRQREFGIGSTSASDPGVLIDSITQITTDPPIWIVSVNGTRIQISSDDLLSQTRFAKRVLDELRILPQPLKAHDWRTLINDLLKNAEVVIAPKDAGPTGMFFHYLEQFCTQRAQAKHREELLLGKPWTDAGRTYFRSTDLVKYLDLQKFREFRANQIYAQLRSRKEVRHETFMIKGVCVQCWSIEEYPRQDGPFLVPSDSDNVAC